MKKIWPFSFYFFYFAAFSALMPFLVLLYQELNFTGTQIGLLTGLPQLILLFAAPFWTSVADRKHLHRLVLTLGIGISIAAIILLNSMTMFVAVFLIILTFNFFLAPVSPLVDSATLSMLGANRAMYGRLRMGGTIGWGLIAPIAGALVDHYGLKISFWGYSVFMLINLFVAQKIVHHDVREHAQSSNQGIRYFFTNRKWLFFLFSAFLGGLGSLTVTSYLFPYMAEMGSTKYMMGIATLIATITEFPIFFVANRLVKRFTAQGLFLWSLVFVGIRSFLFAWVRTPMAVLVVQAFGGMIFPAMWSAGVAYADEQAPAGLKSTAQGLFGAISFGFVSAVGGLIGGMLLESVGGRGMFFVFGILILGGLAVVEMVRRILPPEEVPLVIQE